MQNTTKTKSSKSKSIPRTTTTTSNSLENNIIQENKKSFPQLQNQIVYANITSESTTGCYGSVDYIDANGITGWCLDVSQPGIPLSLEAFCNGILIGQFLCSTLRPDISSIVNQDCYCGFRFGWDQVVDELLAPLKKNVEAEEELNISISIKNSQQIVYTPSQNKIEKREFLEWIKQNKVRVTLQEAATFPIIASSPKQAAALPEKYHPQLKEIFSSSPNVKYSLKFGLLNERVLPIELTIKSQSIGSTPDLIAYIDGKPIENKPNLVKIKDYNTFIFKLKIPDIAFDGNSHGIKFAFRNDSCFLNTRAYLIDPTITDTQLSYAGFGILNGYCVSRLNDTHQQSLVLRVDTNTTYEVFCNKSTPAGLDGISKLNGGFKFQLPDEYLDGSSHRIDLLYKDDLQATVYASFQTRGHLDIFTKDELAGWIYDVGAPHVSGDLDIWVDETLVKTITPNLSRADVGVNCGFSTSLSPYTIDKLSYELKITIHNSDKTVLQSPRIYFSQAHAIRLLQDMAAHAHDGKLGISNRDGSLFRNFIAKNFITHLRQNTHDKEIRVKPLSIDPKPRKVTVIVPIYDGVAETMRCLDALFESIKLNETKFNILLINDCSPNPNIPKIIASYKDQPNTQILTNSANQGFVKTVNSALTFCDGDDFILLNADAVVNGDWVDRLKCAAYSSPAVASVTPFSNNATVCSYPDPIQENDMPADLSLADLDAICREVNSKIVVAIPSGVGFCMFLRADAIAEVGLLNYEKFGLGYAEENDWCIRARDLGWKHLHTCDTFVEHIGGVSFGQDKKTGLVEKNLKVLAEIYPEYSEIVIAHIADDPARKARNNITLNRIKRRLSTFASIHLYITHSLGGGIEVYCNDQIKNLLNENTAVIIMSSNETGFVISFEELAVNYPSKANINELAEELKQLLINNIRFNSDIGFETSVWSLPGILGVPYDVIIHDYLFVCPRVNFTVKTGNYCGEPVRPEVCDRCVKNNSTFLQLEARYSQFTHSTSQWREFYGKCLSNASKVIVPDEDVKVRMLKYFSHLKLDLVPHAPPSTIVPVQPPRMSMHQTLRIGIIGAIGLHKGYKLLLDSINIANAEGYNIHFIIIGHTLDDKTLMTHPNVTITGRYDKAYLQQIIQTQELHAALFLSPWPETYSYTLSECLAAGVFPIVLPIGAPASRLRNLKTGLILKNDTSAKNIVHEIIDFFYSE